MNINCRLGLIESCCTRLARAELLYMTKQPQTGEYKFTTQLNESLDGSAFWRAMQYLVKQIYFFKALSQNATSLMFQATVNASS